MSTVERLFKDLRQEIAKTLLVDVLLSTVIVFLLLHLVLSLFGIPFWVSLILALLYFTLRYRKRVNRFELKTIEDKNVSVKEILRTAKDNMSDTSLMASALFVDLLKRMRDVSIGTILNSRNVIVKTLTVAGLSFVIVLLAGFNINTVLFNVPDAVGNILKGGDDGARYQFGQSLKEDDSIFGDSNLVALGNEEITIKIDPRLNALDFQEEQEVQDTQFQNAFPIEDLGATADQAYTESFGDLADLAAKYTIEIRK
ncbi:MAG: hypothetical protein ABIA93_05320 [Candidatus Woesearchaeota archaeon]